MSPSHGPLWPGQNGTGMVATDVLGKDPSPCLNFNFGLNFWILLAFFVFYFFNILL